MWSMVRLARPLVGLAGKVPAARAGVWRRLVAHPERVPTATADDMVLGVPQNMRHSVTGPRALAEFTRAIIGFRVEPLDGSIPVTVAWGDKDRFTPYDGQAARAREVLPHAHHVTLYGCGHIPFFDDPDQVSRVLLESIPHG